MLQCVMQTQQKANNEFGWKAEFGIDRICEDFYR